MQRKRWNGWKNIKIVPKTDNRPIENVWALVARAVYARKWEAKNEAELC
jgi:hypothetical protein